MRKLRSSFFTGLLTLLPIWLVWVVFKVVFGMLSDVSRPLVGPLMAHLAATDPEMLGWLAASWVQTAIALMATLIFVLLVGLMARRVAGLQFIRWFEALIGRIPLAKSVYGSARQLLDMLQTKPDGSQRVVLINFPHENVKSVGFVTRIFNDAVTGREIAAVYVPTTPNPTGGYLELVPVEDLTPTDWSVDQAMTFILSGGAVSPDLDNLLPFDKTARLKAAE
jgi:uncharacterized membrane protein